MAQDLSLLPIREECHSNGPTELFAACIGATRNILLPPLVGSERGLGGPIPGALVFRRLVFQFRIAARLRGASMKQYVWSLHGGCRSGLDFAPSPRHL